jgi:N-acyl-D-amino-acid deacylase
MLARVFAALLVTLALPGPARAADGRLTVIRGGTVYDGTGTPGRVTDVAIRGDRIELVGDASSLKPDAVVDARGLAVAPGFINMLSWSTESLLVDGKSQGEIRQGVTTQIMGEGWSMGPLTDVMKQRMKDEQADLKFEVAWTTLAEYLAHLEKKGVAQNVASYVGAATIREHVIGLDDRPPTSAELDQMRALVAKEMEAGALGIGTSLIYAPGFYAKTEELIELCKVAAKYQGKYISHLRSEGDRFLEAIDELVRISREAGLPAEIYHLKAAGESNWPKMDQAIARIEAARKEGLAVTADMYTYVAGATGFDACVPRWSLQGGQVGFRERLKDPATRARILKESATPGMGFENLCLATGSPERILLVGFKTDALKPLTGRTLADVAKSRGKDPYEVMLDLMNEDQTRIDVVFFLMSEDNVRKQIKLPWMSFGSDASSMAPVDPFTRSSAHPRAYGNFARLLGRYVREEKLIDLAEAVRRLTSLPAGNLGLKDRGRLAAGQFADVAVFDPATIADRATFEKPHQYAVGMKHVFVNGVAVLKDGEHTGALPGRALKGPGAAAGR